MLPHLDKIIGLERTLEKTAGSDFFEAFHKRELRKGKYLLCEGEVCKHIWFLQKGLARIFDRKDGMEIIRYFYSPGELINAYCSSVQQIPSEVSIQLLEDAVVYNISRFAWEKLAVTYPAISQIEKLLMQCHGLWLERRLYTIQHSNITEQYLHFLHQQAPIIKRLTVTNIASYLGVPIETVSRIKKKLEVGV